MNTHTLSTFVLLTLGLAAQHPLRDFLTVLPPNAAGDAQIGRYTSTTGSGGPFTQFLHPGFRGVVDRVEVMDRDDGRVLAAILDASQISRIVRRTSPFAPVPGFGGTPPVYQSEGRITDFKTTSGVNATPILVVETVGGSLRLRRVDGASVTTVPLPGSTGTVTEDVAGGVVYVVTDAGSNGMLCSTFTAALAPIASFLLPIGATVTPIDAVFSPKAMGADRPRLYVSCGATGGQVLLGYVANSTSAGLAFSTTISGNRFLSVDESGDISLDEAVGGTTQISRHDPANYAISVMFSTNQTVQAFTWAGRSALGRDGTPATNHTNIGFDPMLLPGTSITVRVNTTSAPWAAAELRLAPAMLPTPVSLGTTADLLIDPTNSIAVPLITPLPPAIVLPVGLPLSMNGTQWYAQIFGASASGQLYASSMAAVTAGLQPVD